MAAEILIVDHETVGLSAQLISVDARTFVLLAQSESPDELARAAELWRGEFLPDLALDIEEFETWHRQEANRLSSAAGVVFEALYRYAVASGDGDRAIAEAERLVALDPAREDRQRNALKLLARHKGREAAMGRAKQLVDHLRVELGVVPEAATRALITPSSAATLNRRWRLLMNSPQHRAPASSPPRRTRQRLRRSTSRTPQFARTCVRHHTDAQRYGVGRPFLLAVHAARRDKSIRCPPFDRYNCPTAAGNRTEIAAHSHRLTA